MNSVIRESFLTGIRKELFKKICKGDGGSYQWRYIIGKCSRYPDGRRIILTKDTLSELHRVIDYMNSSEGLEELNDMGIDPPTHPDELIHLIQAAKTDREMKSIEFGLFRKHKNQILKYLARVL